MKLRQLKIDEIKIPEPRVTARFSPEIWEQFQGSMKTTGQLTPILVYETKDGLYLCDGLHRLIEARQNGETTIQAVVMPGDLADVLTKNIMLDHLRGKTPVSEMVAVIKFLWKEEDLSSDDIVAKTGLTREYVEKLQRISELTVFCLEQLDQERIGVGQAFELTRVKDPVRQETVCGQALMYHWSIKELHDFIADVLAMVEATPEEVPSEEERGPVLIKCTFCHTEVPVSQIANPNTCSSCAGVLFATISEAERQFREEQKASEK